MFFSDGAHKNYGSSVIFDSDVILDVDVILVDLNQPILKLNYFLKHDISELTVCSGVANLALFKVKIKIFKVEIDLQRCQPL